MDVPSDRPIISPIMVDRGREIAALEQMLQHTARGHGQIALISGEAGIGKSRLIAEAQARAEARGFLTLVGRCFQAEASFPYAPLIDLLRSPGANQSKHRTPESSAGINDPGKLLAELIVPMPDGLRTTAFHPEQEKHRIFDALTTLILSQTSIQPVFMVLEDVHWSDEISREYLLYLARRAASHPFLLILSYRNDEIDPELRHFLAEIDHERLAVDIGLSPLARDSVGSMLQAILALERPVSAEFLDAIYLQTEGNPFFVEEVLKSILVAGDLSNARSTWDHVAPDEVRIPWSVQDAVWRRLSRISPPAQHVLTLAAVAGQRFDFSLLHELTGQPEAELLSLIKELITAQLVIEESVEAFAFRHALTRHAIYRELLARERQATHRVIAEALERVYGESSEIYLPDLAHHFHHAGIPKKTMFYAPRMGERALAMYAPRSAITHFTRAIEAAQALGQPPSPSWHRARAKAHELRGEFEQAQRDYECVLDTARSAKDYPGEWQSLLDLGFLWLARDYDRAGDFLRAALELARRIDDPQRLALSLNRLGNWYVNMEEPRRGQDLHRQALAIFEELNDRRGMADSRDLLGVSTYLLGNRRGAIIHFEEATEIYRELNERQGLVSTLATLAHLRSSSRIFETLSHATHNWERTLRECEEALVIAREIAWRSGEVYGLCELAACLSAVGEYGRALAIAEEGLLIAEEIEHGEWLSVAHCNLGIIYLDLLMPGIAIQHCERAYVLAQETGSRHMIGLSGAFLASAYVQMRDPARAEALLQEIVKPDAPVETLTQSVSLAAYGELALRRGEPVLALEIADRLIAWAEQSGGAGVSPRLSTLRGEALANLQRTTEAEADLRAAQDEARQQYARPLLWRIQLALGAMLQAQARRDEAEQAYTAARSVIDELAGTLPTEELQEQFRSHILEGVRPRSRSRAVNAQYGGLTAREREVAALIARGYSNRGIAEALVVSERTVEAHTSHIREKLGFTSRTQVAAWAVEQGLVNDPQ